MILLYPIKVYLHPSRISSWSYFQRTKSTKRKGAIDNQKKEKKKRERGKNTVNMKNKAKIVPK
jgi:hypothetical protein